MGDIDNTDDSKEWTIVEKKKRIPKEKNIINDQVPKFPYEILPLYIGEILTMKSAVRGVDDDFVENPNIHDHSKIGIKEYTRPLHFHAQCQCDACCVWVSSARKWIKKNPLMIFQDDFHRDNISISQDRENPNKIKYYIVNENKDLDNLSDEEEEEITIDTEEILKHENWRSQCKNNIERKILSLILKTKNPNFMKKYDTNWFKLLIKDRLPFTDNTVLVRGVKEIHVDGYLIFEEHYGLEEPETSEEMEKQAKFTLKPYKGNFTYSHVRTIKKRLMSITFDTKREDPETSVISLEKNIKAFGFYSGNGTEVEVKFIDGILTIIISELHR
jgi:hypothetical protein